MLFFIKQVTIQSNLIKKANLKRVRFFCVQEFLSRSRLALEPLHLEAGSVFLEEGYTKKNI
jgi:hypothetical protein